MVSLIQYKNKLNKEKKMNGVKTFILMFFMMILLMFIGNSIGGRNGMMIAFGFAMVSNFVSYWYSDKIVLKMYKAQLVGEEEFLYKVVERIAKKADLPMPKVYIINERQPNAFATGRNPKNAAVAATRGLLDILDENELAGVMAHELGHVENRDILIGTVAATMAAAIMMLSRMAQWSAIFSGGRGRDREGGGNGIALIVIAIVAPISAMLLKAAISRTREFKADKYGAKYSGNPMYLASALKKLEMGVEQNPMQINAATENMFIVSPFSQGAKMSNLFSTHPLTSERIKKLQELRESGL